MSDLGTITLNTIHSKLEGNLISFEKITQPTSLQQKALDKKLSIYLVFLYFVPSKAGALILETLTQHEFAHFVKGELQF